LHLEPLTQYAPEPRPFPATLIPPKLLEDKSSYNEATLAANIINDTLELPTSALINGPYAIKVPPGSTFSHNNETEELLTPMKKR